MSKTFCHLFGLLAIGCPTALKAQVETVPTQTSQSEDWSDEQYWQQFKTTFALENNFKEHIFANVSVKNEIKRTGVLQACKEIASFTKEVVTSAAPDYRSLVVAEIRRRGPGKRDSSYSRGLSPAGVHHRGIARTIETVHPEIFEAMYSEINLKLLPRLKNLVAIKGEWRGPMQDWNFDGGNKAIWSVACSVATSSNPTVYKLPYNGFFVVRNNP